MRKDASWVIRSKSDGRVIFETFNGALVAALNTEKYEAVPILEYLYGLNKNISDASKLGIVLSTDSDIECEEEDALNCGILPDGTCMNAGSEDCDDCPFR